MKTRVSLQLIVVILSFFSFSLVTAQETENYKSDKLLDKLQKGDRAALLMVHFGTSYDETRSLTIDAINAKAKDAFPELEVREAYTSRIILRILKRRGVEKHSPLEALLRLRAEGYTHVIVQSTTLLEGAEMESLYRDVESMLPFFKEIRIGHPLLYSVDDCRRVAEILVRRHSDKADLKKKSHVVFVGHGTHVPATATYSQMDMLLKEMGQPQMHVSTIEGYPDFDATLSFLKAAKAKNLTLIPFLFVAGDHASNDIAVEWRHAFEKEGMQVGTCLEGLGQIEEIQNIYIDHIRFALENLPKDIMQKKKVYYEQGK